MSNTTFTANVLIGERDAQGNMATPTKIGGVPIAAALEVQSKVGAFVPPRMSTDEKDALDPIETGSIVWDTTLNQLSIFDSAQWANFTTTTTKEVLVSLDKAAILAMFAVPRPLFVQALTAFQMIVVEKVVFRTIYDGANFGAGGDIRIQYGNAGGAVSAVFGNAGYNSPAEILTAHANDTIYIAGSSFNGLASAVYNAAQVLQTGIYITNTGFQFTDVGVGNNAKLILNILYRVIDT